MQAPKTYTCILGKPIKSHIYVSLNIKAITVKIQYHKSKVTSFIYKTQKTIPNQCKTTFFRQINFQRLSVTFCKGFSWKA